MNGEGVIHITDKKQYDRYLKEYRCSTLNEFEETMWYTYGVSVEMTEKMRNGILFSEGKQ